MDFFVVFCIFLAFCSGFGAAFVWQWQVKRAALSVVRAQANKRGQSAQAEQESELMAMLMEAGQAFKAAKASGKDIQTAAGEIVPALVAKYPHASMKFGKKLFKIFNQGGGLDTLEDLF